MRKSNKMAPEININSMELNKDNCSPASKLIKSIEAGRFNVQKISKVQRLSNIQEARVSFRPRKHNKSTLPGSIQLLNELVDPWSSISRSTSHSMIRAHQSFTDILNRNRNDEELRKSKLVQAMSPLQIMGARSEFTLTPENSAARKSSFDNKTERKESSENIWNSPKKSTYRLSRKLIRHNSELDFSEKLSQKNEEVAMKQFSEILVLQAHNLSLKKELRKYEPESTYHQKSRTKRKIKPSIVTSQKPLSKGGTEVLRMMCPKLSHIHHKDLNKNNINKYLSLRDGGCSQHNALIKANKFEEVPNFQIEEDLTYKDNLKLGQETMNFINKIKDHSLKECFETYCEKSKFGRNRIEQIFHKAQKNLAGGECRSFSVEKIRLEQYIKPIVKESHATILPPIEENKFEIHQTTSTNKSLPPTPNIILNKDLPLYSKAPIHKTYDKSEINNLQTHNQKDIYTLSMEKQYKAENRRELFLREKSKRFAHDHNLILEKVRNEEEIQYIRQNNNFLQKHFPERLNILNIKK